MQFFVLKFVVLMSMWLNAIGTSDDVKNSGKGTDFLFRLLPIQKEVVHGYATKGAADASQNNEEECFAELKRACWF